MPRKSKKETPAAQHKGSLVELVRKKFGKYAAITITGEKESAAAQIKGHCRTGIDVLDRYVIGGGGLPEGRMSEIFGPEGCGKTSLGYAAMAQVQHAGGVAFVADAEYSFDEERAKVFGVNLDTLVIVQPRDFEQHFEIMKTVLHAHSGKVPLLYVHDSIASTKSKTGMEADAGQYRVGEIPRLLSEELPKLPPLLHKKRAHLMMLNQIRAKIGVMFGDNTTTPGGNAPKFYASVRLQILGGKKVTNSRDEHTGKIVTIMAVKNRLAPPWRKARVRLDYATGWNNEWSTIEHAINMDLMGPREDEDGEDGKKKRGSKKTGAKAYAEATRKLGWGDGVDSEKSNAGAQDEGDDFEIDLND